MRSIVCPAHSLPYPATLNSASSSTKKLSLAVRNRSALRLIRYEDERKRQFTVFRAFRYLELSVGARTIAESEGLTRALSTGTKPALRADENNNSSGRAPEQGSTGWWGRTLE